MSLSLRMLLNYVPVLAFANNNNFYITFSFTAVPQKAVLVGLKVNTTEE